jgi:hypothetical protein
MSEALDPFLISCVHESGHAIAGLRLDRPLQAISANPSGLESLDAILGQTLFTPGTEEEILQPDDLRGNLVVVAAGDVAGELFGQWTIWGGHWPNEEQRAYLAQAGCPVGFSLFSDVFRHDLGNTPRGQLAQAARDGWQRGTDHAHIANVAAAVVYHPPPARWPSDGWSSCPPGVGLAHMPQAAMTFPTRSRGPVRNDQLLRSAL